MQGRLLAFPRRQQQGTEERAGLTEGFLGAEMVSLKTGRISSPELGGTQGLVDFPVQGFVAFFL